MKLFYRIVSLFPRKARNLVLLLPIRHAYILKNVRIKSKAVSTETGVGATELKTY